MKRNVLLVSIVSPGGGGFQRLFKVNIDEWIFLLVNLFIHFACGTVSRHFNCIFILTARKFHIEINRIAGPYTFALEIDHLHPYFGR
jgi:hypothetical protein